MEFKNFAKIREGVKTLGSRSGIGV